MPKAKYSVFLILILSLLLISGCKKGTKLEPAVEKQPPRGTEVETEPSQPTTQPPQIPEEPEVIRSEVKFEVIHFDFDKYNLRPEAVSVLNENAKVLMDNPDVKIRIEGHCDERGTIEYNLALGEKRALAAKDHLVNLGISPFRIEIISYGKERPLDLRHNEEAWAKNRRDDFIIIFR